MIVDKEIRRVAAEEALETLLENNRSLREEIIKLSTQLAHWRSEMGYDTPEEAVDALNTRFEKELPASLAKSLWRNEVKEHAEARAGMQQIETYIDKLFRTAVYVALELELTSKGLKNDGYSKSAEYLSGLAAKLREASHEFPAAKGEAK